LGEGLGDHGHKDKRGVAEQVEYLCLSVVIFFF
jgi:hypothetical protein